MKLISCLRRLWRNPLFRFTGMAGLLFLATAGRSVAQTDYLYYSGSIDDLTDENYTFDTISNEWVGDTPDDPGCLVGGENFSVSVIDGYYYDTVPATWTYAQDTVTGQWYFYGGFADVSGGDAWVTWEDPYFDSTDFTYGWAGGGGWTIYDNVGGYWWYSLGNDGPYDESDWEPWDNGQGRDYGIDAAFFGEIIGGQNWTYYTIGGTNYAYDSDIDTWYVDDDYQDDPYNDEIWSVTCDPY